jgi:hypothetical protein
MILNQLRVNYIYFFCCTFQKFSRIIVLYDPIKLGKLYIRFLFKMLFRNLSQIPFGSKLR